MAMKPRERNLGILTGALVLLVGFLYGGPAVSSLFGGGATSESTLEEEVQEKEEKAEKARETRRRLTRWEHRSLPSNRELAKSVYEDWLTALAEEKLLKFHMNSSRSRSAREAYWQLSVIFDAEGTMAHLVDFLHVFYSAGHLHRIRQLGIVPVEGTDPSDPMMKLTFTVDALSLPGADRKEKLFDASKVDAEEGKEKTFPRPQLGSLAAYGPALIERNPFAVSPSPLAGDDEYATVEETLLEVAAENGLLKNDQISPDHTASIVKKPPHGTLELNPDGSFQYTPDENYFGPDRFTYQVGGDRETSEPATVTIAVSNTNDPPQAVDDERDCQQNQALEVSSRSGLLADDGDLDPDINIDPGVDELVVTLVDGPTHGSLTLEPDGSFEYTPAVDFLGEDTFTYRVTDQSKITSDPATVTITVALPTEDEPTGFEVLKHVYVTGIVGRNETAQVWLHNRITGEQHKKSEGESLVIADTKVTILRIGDREVEIDLDGQSRAVAKGESLIEDLPVAEEETPEETDPAEDEPMDDEGP
ncbi:MAG: tandem-95 repeat protein [Planctomycetes bacterium]|nr:tandem-95 repeat protein [Planctomycetota bacterium]